MRIALQNHVIVILLLFLFFIILICRPTIVCLTCFVTDILYLIIYPKAAAVIYLHLFTNYFMKQSVNK